jgi:hypothetical protein
VAARYRTIGGETGLPPIERPLRVTDLTEVELNGASRRASLAEWIALFLEEVDVAGDPERNIEFSIQAPNTLLWRYAGDEEWQTGTSLPLGDDLPGTADLGEIYIGGEDGVIEQAGVYLMLLEQLNATIRQATLSLSILRKTNMAAGNPNSFTEDAAPVSIDGPRVIIYEP